MIGPIEVDLSEVVDGFPQGDYNVNVVNAEQKTSKAGNSYIRWQFTVFNHPEPKYNGQAIWHNTPTSGKGAFRLVQLWKAAMGSELKGATLDPSAIMGKQLSATIVPSHDQDGNLNGFSEVKSLKAYRG